MKKMLIAVEHGGIGSLRGCVAFLPAIFHFIREGYFTAQIGSRVPVIIRGERLAGLQAQWLRKMPR